jgi:uncharacterized membrane protein
MHPEQSKPTEAPIRRIEALDVARGTALAAMAIYHFAWDLEFFGYAQTGMTAAGGWKLFARCIASSFLFLVGVSLFLAHGRGIRWSGFWRRLAMVAGAAAAISLVTWLAVPRGFIFFGILHQIALASLLGLAFLRLSWWATLIAAAAVIAAPNFLRSEFFDHSAWWWTGLSPANPRSNDYVPVFPWFGAVLIGLASAKLASSQGLLARLAAVDIGRWSLPFTFAGRHSLAVYLIHQPVLIAGLWLFAQAFPAPVETPEVQFRASCEATCEESRDAEFCTRYCVCMLDALEPDGLLNRLFAGDQSAELRSKIETFAGQCTIETDNSILEGGAP